MEQAKLARDFLDTLAWPLVVTGITVLLSWRFRESIAGLINRIQKASGLGVQVEAPILQAPQEPLDLEAGPEAAGMSEVIQDLTRRYGTKIGELTETAEAAQRETRGYVTYYYYYHFERIYRLIYGTQIRLMQELARLADKTAPSQDLVRFFDNHRRQMANIGEQPLGYEVYLAFLKNSQMIEDAGDQALRLTTWGEWFLGYIRAASLLIHKPY